MSLSKYKKPLNLELKPSKFLYYFILLIHILALSVLMAGLNIHTGILLILGLLIIISMYISLKQNSSVEFKLFIEKIQYLKDMEWCLVSSDKQSTVGVLQENWFVLPWMLILYFKIDKDKNQVIIILPDMITKSDLRLLKLHLSLIKS